MSTGRDGEEAAGPLLERLDRIRQLDRAQGDPGELLAELCALVDDAERWAAAEGDGRADAAVGRLREALGGAMIRA